MDKENNAVNTDQSAAADKVESPTIPTEVDYEAQLAALEKAKNDAIVEASNWKVAALKAKSKQKENLEDEESEEEKIERIVQEKLAETKIASIDAEKEALLTKLAKENKELKLAHLNKNPAPPATIGTHNENQIVPDTLLTPDQLAAFKAKGWTDKDIERYKKNLQRYGSR